MDIIILLFFIFLTVNLLKKYKKDFKCCSFFPGQVPGQILGQKKCDLFPKQKETPFRITLPKDFVLEKTDTEIIEEENKENNKEEYDSEEDYDSEENENIFSNIEIQDEEGEYNNFHVSEEPWYEHSNVVNANG